MSRARRPGGARRGNLLKQAGEVEQLKALRGSIRHRSQTPGLAGTPLQFRNCAPIHNGSRERFETQRVLGAAVPAIPAADGRKAHTGMMGGSAQLGPDCAQSDHFRFRASARAAASAPWGAAL
jgi:hypothetical protein